jgi:glycosyltransferase involved in cell wall biosynthesis
MTAYHWRRKTWNHAVDTFIVATKFSQEKHVKAGVLSAKMAVLPHFSEEPPDGMGGAQPRGDYALYAGRLSQEKGVDLLLEAWRNIKQIPLHIIGSGPKAKDMANFIKIHGLTNVKILGFQKSLDYLKTLAGAKFLVVPSECYENFPRVVADAFACGVPVVANRLGTMEEIVEDGHNGFLFAESDAADLAAKATDLVNDEKKYAQMCVNARQSFELKYTASRQYEGLMSIYERACDVSKK